MKSIAFIGAGNMGEAIIKGLIGNYADIDIGIYEIDINRQKILHKKYHTSTLNSYSDINNFDCLVLAVKPQSFSNILPELNKIIDSKLVIISIAAGITISFIQKFFPYNPIVRVMPNTPSLLGFGMSGIAYSENCSIQTKSLTQKIFTSLGEILEVPEKLINPITAISGSGPAYFYLLADIFAKKAEKLHLNYNDALLLVSKTMEGAAKMLLKKHCCPDDLIKKVASKGGTTETALNVLRNSSLPDIIEETILSAKNRADELAVE